MLDSTGMIEIDKLGFNKLPTVYMHEFREPGESWKNEDGSPRELDMNHVKKLSERYSGYPIVCLDIEPYDWAPGWGLEPEMSDEELAEVSARYESVLDVWQSNNPHQRVGFWGWPHYLGGVLTGKRKLSEQMRFEEALASVYEKQTAIFPSFYLRTHDIEMFVDWIKLKMDMIQLLAPSRPIFPYVCPRYMSNTYKGEYMDEFAFTTYLKICELAIDEFDGDLVLWVHSVDRGYETKKGHDPSAAKAIQMMSWNKHPYNHVRGNWYNVVARQYV